MFFNNHVFAHLSSNGFTVQTSWYMGMHKPKPCSTFSGYFYLSSCSMILYMYWLSTVHIVCLCKHSSKLHMYTVQAYKMIAISATSAIWVLGILIVKFVQMKTHLAPNSMQYWQDNAHKNNSCYWYSVLINEHISPQEHETSFPLKNVVFER